MPKRSPFYLPILKGKLAEWGALAHVPAEDRANTFPLIELNTLTIKPQQTPGNAFQEALERTQSHLEKIEDKAWTLGIDVLHFLPSAPQQAKILATVCSRLSKHHSVAPCVLPSMVSQAPGDVEPMGQYEDVFFRIPIRSWQHAQIAQVIRDAWACLGRQGLRMHVILDMHELVGVDPPALASAIAPYVSAAVTSNRVSSVTLAGGSFPINLTGIGQGNKQIPRVEWQAWKSVRSVAGLEDVQFGDYAVTNPHPQEPIDPKKVNASAAIRYACEDDWMLIKGGGTRTSGFGQYNGLCTLLLGNPWYSGETYSYGDERYHHHAQAGSKSGNLQTWRRDATSHHLALTARNYASRIAI